MLDELILENVVLFEQARLAFAPGLNVISGETGSGKSLLAQALALVLGERARADVLRAEADRARVTAAFRIEAKDLADALAEAGAEPDEEGRLVLERTLRRDGPSRFAANGRPVSVATGRTIRERLLDMAAQNEHTRILEPAYQRQLLDRYGRIGTEAAAFAEAFRAAAALERRLRADDAERERARRRREEIAAHLEALDALGYDPQTDPFLEERIRALSHAETVRALAEEAEQTLYEGEEAVQDRIGALREQADELADAVEALAEARQTLEAIETQIEEAVRAFRAAAAEVESGPEALDAAIERSEELKRLARRLGVEPEALPATEGDLRAEADRLASWDADTDEIRRRLDEALGRARESGARLSARRAEAAATLAEEVDRELAGLGMPEAGFFVELEPLLPPDAPPERMLAAASAEGLEEVSFRLRPNPGERPTTLAQTASGGEASRAMLALKSALSRVHRPPVLLFDEIDAGVGGRLGDVLARKLKELAADRQVIVITHLPQIAAVGDVHVRVEKTVAAGRTLARAEMLEGEARVEELAAMIRGGERTATTRRQAEEMLASSPPPKKSGAKKRARRRTA